MTDNIQHIRSKTSKIDEAAFITLMAAIIGDVNCQIMDHARPGYRNLVEESRSAGLDSKNSK